MLLKLLVLLVWQQFDRVPDKKAACELDGLDLAPQSLAWLGEESSEGTCVRVGSLDFEG